MSSTANLLQNLPSLASLAEPLLWRIVERQPLTVDPDLLLVEAIDIYAQNHRSIAIVLIDMMMPNLDTRWRSLSAGESTILALQQINPQVQMVVMSGSYLNLEAMVDSPVERICQRSHVSAFLIIIQLAPCDVFTIQGIDRALPQPELPTLLVSSSS